MSLQEATGAAAPTVPLVQRKSHHLSFDPPVWSDVLMSPDAPRPKPRLPRGPSALDPDDRSRVHRQRLQDALVALVAERGFVDTRIREICSHAQVGPRDLYAEYPGKQELLLSTCDAIADEAIAAVRAGLRDSSPPATAEAAIAGVLVPFARSLAARPAHAELLLVHVFSAGAVGPSYRRGLITRLRTLLTDALQEQPEPGGFSEASLIIVASGALQAFQHRIRTGRARGLPVAAQELAAWAAHYRTGVPLPLPRPASPATLSDTEIRPLPRNTQRLPRQFVLPHQRDRIMRAVVALSVSDGFAAMSIPAIAGEAQISIRTFYQHFASKHEAFDAVYDHAFGRLFARTWAAATRPTTWLDAVRDGVRAWVGYAATEPGMARFAFCDALTAGPEFADKLDEAYTAFANLFNPNAAAAPPVSDLVAFAIAGGYIGLVTHWIADLGAADVQYLEPHLVYAILAPILGDSEALHASGLAPTPRVIRVPAPSDDGERIAVAFTRLVATEGLANVTLEAAADEAGVARSVVGEYFEDETACALQTLDAWSDRTFTAMNAAFASAPRDGALAIHRALGAMLAQIASEPDALRLAVEALEQLGPRAVSRRARYAAVFLDAVAPSVGSDDPIPAHPRQVSEMVADGVLGVLRQHVAEDRIDALPDALAEISYLCVAPFFGPRRATDVSQLPLVSA